MKLAPRQIGIAVAVVILVILVTLAALELYRLRGGRDVPGTVANWLDQKLPRASAGDAATA